MLKVFRFLCTCPVGDDAKSSAWWKTPLIFRYESPQLRGNVMVMMSHKHGKHVSCNRKNNGHPCKQEL